MLATYQKVLPAIYEGKASRLYDVQGCPNCLIIERKDEVTKLDGKVHAQVDQKGVYANKISNLAFAYLEEHSISTHYICAMSERETVIEKATPILLEVIIRNIAAGSLCRRLPIKEGTVLETPIIEIDYKSDEYGDPLINDGHAVAMKLVTWEQLNEIYRLTKLINSLLKRFFEKAGLQLVDIKLEFGITADGNIILIDEISPDTMRLWSSAGQSFDKDIFRKEGSLEEMVAAYAEVYRRLS